MMHWMRGGVVLGLTACLLQGCASSQISRSADEQAEAAYASGNLATNDATSGISPNHSWQNSSQATKGVLIGGVTGGVAGGLTSGIGWLPGVAGGAIFGGALGAWIDANTTSADQLQNRNANVMVLGDQVRVVLLTGDVFEGDSTTLNTHAYKTLDLVAQLIGRFPNRRVTVAVYTDPGDSDRFSLSLTQKQAESVVRYLWQAGVNTRLIYAAGYGSQYPVARPGGNHPGDNNRIEITFEKLPV